MHYIQCILYCLKVVSNSYLLLINLYVGGQCGNIWINLETSLLGFYPADIYAHKSSAVSMLTRQIMGLPYKGKLVRTQKNEAIICVKRYKDIQVINKWRKSKVAEWCV